MSQKNGGHIGDAEPDSHEPWYRRQRSEEIHSILEKANHKMIAIADRQIERLSEYNFAHKIERFQIKQARHVDSASIRLTKGLLQLYGETFEAVFVVFQSQEPVSVRFIC